MTKSVRERERGKERENVGNRRIEDESYIMRKRRREIIVSKVSK